MQNVIVIFQTSRQNTESLALALALGAVQGGANIRLRHLDPSPDIQLAHAGYGTLGAADLRWAEGIAIILESAFPKEMSTLTQSLAEIAGESSASAKWAYIFQEDSNAASALAIRNLLNRAGIINLLEDSAGRSGSTGYMASVGHRIAALPGSAG